MSGKATYTNKVTGESYKLGFELSEGDTELSKAWDLVEVAARRNGWSKYDVSVKAGLRTNDYERRKRHDRNSG